MTEHSPDKKSFLFFTHYFPPEGNAPASRTYDMAKRWVEMGHEVTIITCAPHAPAGKLYPGYRNKFSQTEYIDGIRVVRVWTLIAANRGTVRRVLNYLSYMVMSTLRALFIRRPDLVIATSPQFFCGWAGVLTHWFKRRPLLLEIRDIWPESITAVGALHSRIIIRMIEALEHKMYRAAQHIVTVGDGYKRCLIARGVPEAKISIIKNGIDTKLFTARPTPTALKRQLGVDNMHVCTYVGTIGLASGLSIVLRAASILKERGRADIAFVLVGDGAQRRELEQQATQQGLDNIVFTGTVSKQDVPDYLAAADSCLVHLRRTDLFKTVLPSKIFEAAAMRRPIILGVEGEAAELLKRADAGLCIEPENEVQLIEAIDKLHTDDDLRKKFTDHGHNFVMQHHNRDNLAKSYEAVLIDTCGGRT